MTCSKCGRTFNELSNKAKKYRTTNDIPFDLCNWCCVKFVNLRKYGIENISQLDSVKQKKEETSLLRYGTKHTLQSKEVRQKAIETNMKKYGVPNPQQNQEIRQKSEETNLKRYGSISPLGNKDIQEKSNQTAREKYGVDHISQAAFVVEKRNKTNLEKYGNKEVLRSDEILEKIKQTNLEKYGVEKPFQSEEIRKKGIETVKDKYGVDNVFFLPEVQEKRKNTNIEIYGVDNIFKSKEEQEKIQEKLKLSNAENYGVISVFSLPEVRKKIEDTLYEKYKVLNPAQDEKIKNKILNTILEHYGVDNVMKIPEIVELAQNNARRTNLIKYGVPNPINLFNKSSDNKFEKRIEEAIKNGILSNEFFYQKQYYVKFPDNIKVNRPVSGHVFDLAIFRKDTKELDTLVDCDGEFWHADGKKEYDGLRSKEEYDSERLLCIPKNVKFCIINEKLEDKGLKELIKILNFNYDEYIQDQFNWCKNNGFPYYNYTDEELNKSWNNLKDYKITFSEKEKRLMGRPGVGDNIIKHFHPSIFHCKTKGNLSPYEAWNNDKLLLECIKNRFIYVNEINPRKVLQGFNINKIAPKISIFSAARAKILLIKYLNEYDTIFDPFSGFSGRLLGTCSLGKMYIGQDINDTVVKESNNIIKYFNLNATVICKDVRESFGEYECLFTCPPYGNLETWNKIKTNIIAEEWVEICLNNFKCKKYLFVVNKECTKYDKYMIDMIINKSHFSKNYEKVILIK